MTAIRALEMKVCAPSGIRTHAVGGLSSVSLPLEYRGLPWNARPEAIRCSSKIQQVGTLMGGRPAQLRGAP